MEMVGIDGKEVGVVAEVTRDKKIIPPLIFVAN